MHKIVNIFHIFLTIRITITLMRQMLIAVFILTLNIEGLDYLIDIGQRLQQTSQYFLFL